MRRAEGRWKVVGRRRAGAEVEQAVSTLLPLPDALEASAAKQKRRHSRLTATHSFTSTSVGLQRGGVRSVDALLDSDYSTAQLL